MEVNSVTEILFRVLGNECFARSIRQSVGFKRITPLSYVWYLMTLNLFNVPTQISHHHTANVCQLIFFKLQNVSALDRIDSLYPWRTRKLPHLETKVNMPIQENPTLRLRYRNASWMPRQCCNKCQIHSPDKKQSVLRLECLLFLTFTSTTVRNELQW